MAAQRAAFDDRRRQVLSIYEADYRDRGRSEASARKRAQRKKLVRIYNFLLGAEEPGGLLGDLARETDPVAARQLAGRILEIDYALKVEGERPTSRNVVDYLPWMSVVYWTIEPDTEPHDADKQALNLVDPATGRFLDTNDLRHLITSGVDISALNPPADSTFWRSPGVIAEVDVEAAFYGGTAPMHKGLPATFPSGEADLDKIKLSQTKPKFEIEVGSGDQKKRYKIKVGGEIHSEPTAGALMATLGFNVDITHYVKNFRINLGDISVAEIRDEWRSYFEVRRTYFRFSFDDYFEEGSDERGPYLLAREAVLEARPPELIRVGPWPFGDNGNEAQREVRAMALFSIWIGNTDLKESENNKLILRESEDSGLQVFHVQHDVGHSFGRAMSEELNAFPWDISEWSPTGKIRFNYRSLWPTSLRGLTTHADARWTVRLIAQLTREQIETAVAIGGWPESAGALLVEKLIHRRNQLVELFDLEGAQTDSGPIDILEVDRHITTPDAAVVDGVLLVSEFEGSTIELANYWEELLGPVWDRILLTAVGAIQAGVSQVPALIFDTDSVGLSAGVNLELLLALRREVRENLYPTSSLDHYLVEDELVIGVRLGAGFVARGEVAYGRRYVLVQPAGTEREARFIGRTILNFLLPYQVAQGNLPDNYVLIRESFIGAGLRLITDDFSGGSFPLGVDATLSRTRVSRSIISHKNGEYLVYRDRSNANARAISAFFRLVFIRIPFARDALELGKLDGEFFIMPPESEDPDSAAAKAVALVLSHGDFRGVRRVATVVDVQSDFRHHISSAAINPLFRIARHSRFDHVEIRHEKPETVLQYRAGGDGSWSLLDYGEFRWHRIRSVTTQRPERESAPTPVIEAAYFISDKNCSSNELANGYLHFINALGERNGAANGKLIDFDPAAHSTNQRWGHIHTLVTLGFSQEAVEGLMALDPAEYWSELAFTLGIAVDDLQRYRGWLRKHGKQRRIYRARIPRRLRWTLLRSDLMMRRHRSAIAADTPDDRLRALADMLIAASYKRRHWYDPRMLATLRRLLGPENVSIDARITQPPWREKRLVGGVDLVAHTHEEPFRLSREQIILAPLDSYDQYMMLETFPPLSRPTGRSLRPQDEIPEE